MEKISKELQEKIGNKMVNIIEQANERLALDNIINELQNESELIMIDTDTIKLIAEKWWEVFINNFLIKQISGTKYYRRLTEKELQEARDFARSLIDIQKKEDITDVG